MTAGKQIPIVWEDPPPSRRGTTRHGPADEMDWVGFVAELQANPGRWAKACEHAPHAAFLSTRKQRLQYRGCEVVLRSTADGSSYTMHARWPEEQS